MIYLIFSVPFSTWLAISYFNTIPSDLEDAALVDGATRLRSLFTIFIPLALPALAVIALFTFTHAWNEFLAGIRFNRPSVPWLVGLYITSAYWFTASTSFANPAVAIARSLTNTFSGIRPIDLPGSSRLNSAALSPDSCL